MVIKENLRMMDIHRNVEFIRYRDMLYLEITSMCKLDHIYSSINFQKAIEREPLVRMT